MCRAWSTSCWCLFIVVKGDGLERLGSGHVRVILLWARGRVYAVLGTVSVCRSRAVHCHCRAVPPHSVSNHLSIHVCRSPGDTLHVQGVTADGRGGVAYEPKVTSAFDGGAERACDSSTTRCSMSLPPHALMLSCSPKCPSLQILPIVPRRAAIAVQRERVR